MCPYGFAPASKSEGIVYGAQRPGYSSRSVSADEVNVWIDFMRAAGIKRVCCLLSENQLKFYKGLLQQYEDVFGSANICRAPVEDYHLCSLDLLKGKILPFLNVSSVSRTPVVVHCSGGSGRTGHVLAAWLVYGRGFSVDDALDAVRQMGRNPLEAVGSGNAKRADLTNLLEACQSSRPK